MPRHGRVWRWSLDELRRAAVGLQLRAAGGTFTMRDLFAVVHDITAIRLHAVGLRQALLREHIIEVVDRSNPRQYVYRVRGSDGKQAQRATPAAD